MKTLYNLFIETLADIYDAEQRLVKALPKMADAATCTHLQEAILAHLEETKDHVVKDGQIFECFDYKARSKTCKAIIRLLEECDEIAEEYAGSPAINAALIAVAQKVEHYEIASYGCLQEWAVRLGNDEAAGLLQEILEEEQAANASFNELALARSNDEALDDSEDEGDYVEEESLTTESKYQSAYTMAANA